MFDRLSPIDVTTVQERVYQSLRLALLKGQLLPGEQVSIRGLAQALGTSAMPVREAVKRLVAEKGLEQSSDRLLYVSPYIPSIHEEYIRIRMKLDGFATERACHYATPELIDKLRSYNNSMREALRVYDIESVLSENHAFHFEIYNAAGYPQLLDIISNLWLRTGPFLATVQRDRKLFDRVFENGYKVHNKAIEAIAQRDGKSAKMAIALDIRAAHLWIRKYYESAILGKAEGSVSRGIANTARVD